MEAVKGFHFRNTTREPINFVRALGYFINMLVTCSSTYDLTPLLIIFPFPLPVVPSARLHAVADAKQAASARKENRRTGRTNTP
jgi:hypothetical protein